MLRLCFENYFTYVKNISVMITKIITVLTEIAGVHPISAHRGGCTLTGYEQIFLSRKLVPLFIQRMYVKGRHGHGIKVACHLQEQTCQLRLASKHG